MSEAQVHHWLVLALFGAAALTFVILRFVTAPYGRYERAGWGPTLPSRAGWVLMEAPACLGFVGIYLAGDHRFAVAPLLLLAVWQFHYVHRTFVFPWRMRLEGKRMPLAVVLMGASFNGLNAYVNARWISHLGDYGPTWLDSPELVVGLGLFACGAWINRRSDAMLAALRRPGESGYRVPRGWLFEYVVNPNYFGECLEWVGWAIATWSLPGAAFAAYTFANLAPRAMSNLEWYRAEFGDEFPSDRRAIVPHLL